jgi:L-ribulose-5-phosphate 3-epimerase
MVAGLPKAWCEMGAGMRSRIGFMQGRLSPAIDGRIQAFPWPFWESEFARAAAIGLSLMEWTLDADRLYENPLMNPAGRDRIRDLIGEHGIDIPSLTGDCFMQEPFWKVEGKALLQRIHALECIVDACSELGITCIVVPLVDAGSVTSSAERKSFVDHIMRFLPLLREKRVAFALESDFAPEDLRHLMDEFPADCIGVNYDMGNSASLGWTPAPEIALLASRIKNVHVKDRIFRGGTVPLGEGAVDFTAVFGALAAVQYGGKFILQTARAADGDHATVLKSYAQFVSRALKA